MNKPQHFVVLQNALLKIKAKKLEKDHECLQAKLKQINDANYELREKMNELSENLMLKIEKDTEIYVSEITKIEESDIFENDREIDERVQQLESNLTIYKATRKTDSGLLFLYILAFAVGILFPSLIKI